MSNAGLFLFSTDDRHPLNRLSFDDQKFMIALTMRQFQQFPLCSGGYSKERLHIYDGVLGDLIRTRDKFKDADMIRILEEYADFTALWEYQGDIFRVIDKSIVYPKEGEPYSRMPKICWHGMVASWSSSFDFTVGFNHMLPESKYTIIHANTGESAGIDTNKLGEHLGYYVSYTESENEIIFPMKKEFVIEVYEDITLTEFKVRMEERLKND